MGAMMPKKVKAERGPYLVHMELMRDRVDSFDKFPFTLAALRKLDPLCFHPQVTFFVGENGTGKSTLLEALAVSQDLNAEGGSRNFNFATKATHVELDHCLRIAKTINLARDSYFLRAESFYNVATEIERLDEIRPLLGSYGGRSLHAQSHGESFFALFSNRLSGSGLYFMDEPEAALSPKRQLEFLAVLHQHCQRGGQFVIATHSPIIMSYPHAVIYEFSEQGIRKAAYQDTDHYQITRGFLENPGTTLKTLLAESKTEAPDT